MKTSVLPFLIALLLITAGCKSQEKQQTHIAWDSWGVPHIYAQSIDDLFYAQGWAQMQNHANLILELYGSSRGKGAEYWGKDKLENDLLIHTLGFEELAEQWAATQDPEVKAIFTAFVKGLNAYAEAHPEAIESTNKQVLPLTVKDANMHGMYVVFTRFIGGNDLGRIQ